jgi:hypothetical protein
MSPMHGGERTNGQWTKSDRVKGEVVKRERERERRKKESKEGTKQKAQSCVCVCVCVVCGGGKRGREGIEDK